MTVDDVSAPEESTQPRTRMVDINGRQVEMRMVDENHLIPLLTNLRLADASNDAKTMFEELQNIYENLIVPLLVNPSDIRVLSGAMYAGMNMSELMRLVFSVDGAEPNREQRRATSRSSRGRGRGHGGGRGR